MPTAINDLSEAVAKAIFKLPLQRNAGRSRPVMSKCADPFYLLDPDVWEHLPQEILVKVVSKLPLHYLAALRTLSKHWKTQLVKEAATLAALIPAGNRASSLICLQPWILESDSGPECCVQVCDSDGHWYEALKNLSSGFISWSEHSLTAQVVAAEGGLLFFSLVQHCEDKPDQKDTGNVIGLTVLNPLTGHSNFLSMQSVAIFPVGAVIRPSWITVGAAVAPDGTYKLLVVGFDELDPGCTILYDSKSCVWKRAAPLPEDLSNACDWEDCSLRDRAVSCNGNLYWTCFLQIGAGGFDVAKYDFEQDSWSKFVLSSGSCPAEDTVFMTCAHSHICWYNGRVLLSHLHQLDPIGLERYTIEQCDVWRQRSDLPELDPNMELMSSPMFDKIQTFVRVPPQLAGDYMTFGQQNLFYSVFSSCTDSTEGQKGSKVRIMVHNTHNNSHHVLEIVTNYMDFCPKFFWSYFPSLIASP